MDEISVDFLTQTVCKHTLPEDLCSVRNRSTPMCMRALTHWQVSVSVRSMCAVILTSFGFCSVNVCCDTDKFRFLFGQCVL